NNEQDFIKIGYEKFDSIIAINVLEHVENDEFAIKELYKMLKNEGTLIILVPCHKFLYNDIDAKVGHFRRYSKVDLEFKVKKTHFKIAKIFYFNMLGILGWYINGNLIKSSTVSPTATKIFDRITPLSRFSERILRRKVGLSLICFLRK
ncbi:MAG: methyltransferase domain-containing protein, partial [Patescibacteria group bacterium]|nr:methyltransferase domain-containing protein [Patescibacteria group bacterium]